MDRRQRVAGHALFVFLLLTRVLCDGQCPFRSGTTLRDKATVTNTTVCEASMSQLLDCSRLMLTDGKKDPNVQDLCRLSSSFCEVLANSQKTGKTCNGYCANYGMRCLEAWNDDGDTCAALRSVTGCGVSLTHDQICRCGGKQPGAVCKKGDICQGNLACESGGRCPLLRSGTECEAGDVCDTSAACNVPCKGAKGTCPQGKACSKVGKKHGDVWDGRVCNAGFSGRLRCRDENVENVDAACGRVCLVDGKNHSHLAEWAAACPFGGSGSRRGRCVDGAVAWTPTCGKGCAEGRQHGESWDGGPCPFMTWSLTGNMRYRCNNGTVVNDKDTCYTYYMRDNTEARCPEEELIADAGECVTAFKILNTHPSAVDLADFQIVSNIHLPKGCYQGNYHAVYNLNKNLLWFNTEGRVSELEETTTNSICKAPAGSEQGKLTVSRITFRGKGLEGRLPVGPHGLDCDWPMCYTSYWTKGQVVGINMTDGNIEMLYDYDGFVITCLSADKKKIGMTTSGCGLVLDIVTRKASVVVGKCGSPGFNGYEGKATDMLIGAKTLTCTFDDDHNFYMIDSTNTRVVKVDIKKKWMTTVLGKHLSTIDTGDCHSQNPDDCSAAANGKASANVQFMRYMGGYIYLTTGLNNARRLNVASGRVYFIGAIPVPKEQVYNLAIDHEVKDVYFIPRETSLKYMYRYTQRNQTLEPISQAVSFSAGQQYGAAIVPQENLILTTTWSTNGMLKYYGYIRPKKTTCSAGHYSPENDVAACLPCPKGTYKDKEEDRTAKCQICPDKHMVTKSQAATRLKDCKCRPTMVSNTSDPSDLTCYCDRGFSYSVDTEECRACDGTGYKTELAKPDSAANKCSLCADYMTGSSAEAGSANDYDCRCPYGYYGEDGTNSSTSALRYCRSCGDVEISSFRLYPKGCPLDAMNIKRGYWRVSQNSRKLMQCNAEDACVGGNTWGRNLCGEGHHGTLCAGCDEGWMALSNDICVRCEDTWGHWQTLIICILAIMILLLSLLFCNYYVDMYEASEKRKKILGPTGVPEAPEESTKEAGTFLNAPDEEVETGGRDRGDTMRSLGSGAATLRTNLAQFHKDHIEKLEDIIQRKLMIVTAFYQMVTIIPQYYPVSFDPQFTTIVAIFNFFNVDVKDYIPFSCAGLGSMDYYSVYLTKAGFILIVWILTGTSAWLYKEQKVPILKVQSIFLFAVYPSISAQSGETFRCVEIGDGSTWLARDMTVRCDNNEKHAMFQYIDIFCIFLFPLGICVFWFLQLYSNMEKLEERIGYDEKRWRDDGEMPEGIGHLSVLVASYEPQYWWYELFECLRKWLLVSGALLLFDGIGDYPSSTILFAIIVNMFTIWFHIKYEPYIHDVDDGLAYYCYFLLLFIYILGAYTRQQDLLDESGYTTPEIYEIHYFSFFAACLVILVAVYATYLAIYELTHQEGEETDSDDRREGEEEYTSKDAEGGVIDSDLLHNAKGHIRVIQQRFEVYDTNKNGYIEFTELMKVCQDLNMTDEEITRGIEHFEKVNGTPQMIAKDVFLDWIVQFDAQQFNSKVTVSVKNEHSMPVAI